MMTYAQVVETSVTTNSPCQDYTHPDDHTSPTYETVIQRYILSENCQKRALCADRRPLRRDTIASRDRFRPIEARQNLALYCKRWYSNAILLILTLIQH